MEVKAVEIRDRATFIPALAIRLGPIHNRLWPEQDEDAFQEIREAERYLLSRSGYGQTPERQCEFLYIINLQTGQVSLHSDGGTWVGTVGRAAQWLRENWEEFKSGSVVDCEFIRGETKEPKTSERLL